MVSATDYPGKSGLLGARDATPRKRRFRLFSALAAPFRDVDERALAKKRPRDGVRNNSKGNVLSKGAATPVRVPASRFPRGGD
jgi:hypothetical protein